MNIFLMIAMVSLVLAGCSDNQASIGNGATPSQAMRVDYVVVHSRPVANKIEMTGTLLAAESALLSAQTSGLVKGIYFKEGEYASRGRLLVKLDDRQWLAQRKKLEAQLDIAQKDLTRKQKLLEIKGISQAEVDDALLQLESIKADIQELDVRIDFAAIRAPFSGRVGLRNVSLGSYLSAGDPVTQLVQVDPLRLEFSVPEKYANQVRSGQSVNFTLSGSDSVYQASVYATEPVISETTRALRIRARVPNRQGELIAGAFAEVNLLLDSIPDALLVPTEAVVPQLNDQIVYRVKGGKVEPIKVKLGVRLAHLLQVQEGLSSGDTVMVSGLLQAKEGLAVKPGEEIQVDKL